MRLCQNAGTASIIRLVICVLNIDNITDKYDLCFYYQLIEICYYEKENYVIHFVFGVLSVFAQQAPIRSTLIKAIVRKKRYMNQDMSHGLFRIVWIQQGLSMELLLHLLMEKIQAARL